MASNAQPTWCHCQLGHNIPVVARSTRPIPRVTELTQGGSWRERGTEQRQELRQVHSRAAAHRRRAAPGHADGPPGRSVMIWIQVRDVRAEHARLAAAGVPVIREPAAEPWGLTEMWIQDPDGIRIVLVEVPADHPLRRDPRSASPPR